MTFLLACVLLLLVIDWAARFDPARQRAVRACKPCDVSAADVDQWIDDCRNSTLDREGLHDLWLATFDERNRDLAGPCEPCVQAILDTAREVDRVLLAHEKPLNRYRVRLRLP